MTKKGWKLMMRAGPLLVLLPQFPGMYAQAASFACGKVCSLLGNAIRTDALHFPWRKCLSCNPESFRRIVA